MTISALHPEPELVPEIPLADLYANGHIGFRAYNVLTTNGYVTIRQVASQTPKSLLRLPNFGRHSLKQIVDVLNISETEKIETKIKPLKKQNPAKTVADDLNLLKDILVQSKLSDRNKEIMKYRLGLEAGKVSTLQELGEQFGISRERVRQIETISLRKLHRLCMSLYEPNERYINIDENSFTKLFEELEDQGFEHPAKMIDVMVDFFVSPASIRMALHGKIPLLARSHYLATKRQDRFFLRQQKIKTAILSLSQRAPENAQDASPFLQEPRTINTDGWGESGNFFSKRYNRDIPFESAGERHVITLVETLENDISWYDAQCIRIPCEEDGRIFEYTPDIIYGTADGKIVVLEVKPDVDMFGLNVFLKGYAAQKYCRSKNWLYSLFCPKFGTLDSILQSNNPCIEDDDILAAFTNEPSFNKGGINWEEYRAILARFDLTLRDGATFCLKNNLAHKTGPFRIVPLSEGRSWSEIV